MNRVDKRIFGTLFFSIFAAVTGVGIVVPLLPVYARNLGAGGVYIGLIFGAFALSRTFCLPYFGRLSDHKGRKPLIVVGLFAYGLVSLAFVFSRSVESLIIIRFFHGIASSMMMPVIQAYIGDITPPGREGFVMGMFNMSMFFGLSLGPVLGGIINDHYSLHAAFYSMGFLALIGFGLSQILLPPREKERIIQKERPPVAWRVIIKDRIIVALFIYRLAYTACIGVIWGFLPVLADAEFSLSSASIGILVMLGVFISGLIQTPMGYVADRVSKRGMAVIGGAVVVLATLYYGWAGGFRDLVLAGLLFGIGGGIAMPAHMALSVIKGAQKDAMGSVMGLMTMGHSLGMLAGALLAGLMMEMFALRQAFTLGALVMVIGITVFMAFTRGPIDLARIPATYAVAKDGVDEPSLPV
jgi:multidrug resistance protein